jgi:hypothetical protein
MIHASAAAAARGPRLYSEEGKGIGTARAFRVKLSPPSSTWQRMKFGSIAIALLCCVGCLARETEIGTWDAGSGGGATGGGAAGGGSANGGGTTAGGGMGAGGGGFAMDPNPVATTDVSILYPLVSDGGSTDYVAPGETGTFGALLPMDFFVAVGGPGLDDGAATYSNLRIVGVRLDPCSKRVTGVTCTPEVRLVFQGLYDEIAPDGGGLGKAATDGAVHVTYDIPDGELVAMLQELLSLKHTNGNIGLQTLAPHPILTAQGLSGPFAQGLRATLLRHVGKDRIARVTVFNHDGTEGQAWTFSIFDHAGDGGLAAGMIPQIDQPAVGVGGSPARNVPLADSHARASVSTVVPDAVAPLVGDRPDAGTPGAAAAMEPVFEAALRVQNPTLHNASNTDCANCHMAEGAVRVGEGLYGLVPTNAFTHARSLVHVDERTSVTNFHAFGYLEREVSIMSRTANESVVAADALQAKLQVQ